MKKNPVEMIFMTHFGMPEPRVSQKKWKNADFGPCFWHDNKVNRKNELCHGQELFVQFSKHSRLLFVEFVNHYWQQKQTHVIFIQISLRLSKILITITSSSFICQSWLTKPTNKNQGCFENGMNSSFSWYNSFFL